MMREIFYRGKITLLGNVHVQEIKLLEDKNIPFK